MGDTVNYSRDDAVAVLAMNRPDALNGFTSELCTDLLAAFGRAGADETVRAVVLTGEGRAFSAGADLKAGLVTGSSVRDKLQSEYRPVLEAIAALPKPVIAAVPGFAAGIGLSFALSCDLVMMAEDAFLLSPFTTIALLPDGGATWLLVRQLGYRRAYQLAIECERIPAARCVELGLVNTAVPSAELRDAAVAWGQSLARLAPLSLAATKKAMRAALDRDWAGTYDLEADLQEELRQSADAAEGVRAFLEKRRPVFRGA